MLHQPYRLRILVVVAFLAVSLLGLVVRLYWIMIVKHDYYVVKAMQHQIGSEPVHPKRGNIYDRNRDVLAAGSLLNTLYANTYLLKQHNINLETLAFDLAPVLQKPFSALRGQLLQGGCPPLARVLPPETADKIHNLMLNDFVPPATLYFERETKRYYPKSRLASHLLGYVRFDDTGENEGVDGLEAQDDWEIRGNYQEFKVLKDARKGLLTPISETYWNASFGNELVLAIDAPIQQVAETALREEVMKYRASWGVVIVQKCKTGEIIAMAGYPDFDPSGYRTADPASLRNRAINEPAGIGSGMKIFTAAALIETGKITSLDETFNCHGGIGYFPPRKTPVRDAPGHELYIATFRDIFRWSSNVGMVEAAQRLDRNQYSRILESFGFGQKTSIDLPNERQGILRPVGKWTDYSMSALPYGGEMTVTPIQMAAAVSAVANGGLLMKPYVVKEIRSYEGRLVHRFQPAIVRRVISPVTAGKVLELMEGAVGRMNAKGELEAGTGKEAQIRGYRVAGKTGTFKYGTPSGGDQASSYTASFVAVLPLPDPELTVFCCIDQPQGAKFGGAVAAPVVRRVSEHALRILGIPPGQSDRGPTDVQVTLHEVRNTSRVVRSVAPRGQMPDLRGLTMREVYGSIAGLDLELSFEGSGVVVEQEPAPLAPLRGVHQCRVVFDRPNMAQEPPAAASAAGAASTRKPGT